MTPAFVPESFVRAMGVRRMSCLHNLLEPCQTLQKRVALGAHRGDIWAETGAGSATGYADGMATTRCWLAAVVTDLFGAGYQRSRRPGAGNLAGDV